MAEDKKKENEIEDLFKDFNKKYEECEKKFSDLERNLEEFRNQSQEEDPS